MNEIMAQETGHDTRVDTLYVTDAELIRRMGTPRDKTKLVIESLDNDPRSGFPQKQKLWGNRRYWPAVKAFFDLQNGLKMGASENRRDKYER